MVCVTTEVKLVARVTGPLPAELVPMETPPSSNVTMPVGVPTPGDVALTVAVNVTLWPKTDGFDALLTVVVTLAGFTV